MAWKKILLEGDAGGGGHTIRNEGVDLAARTGLNFLGGLVVAVDDAGGNESEIRIGKQPDGTDLFATSDSEPHASIGGSGKIIRVRDALELPNLSTPPGWAPSGYARHYEKPLGALFSVPYHKDSYQELPMLGGLLGALYAKGQFGMWHPASDGSRQVDGLWVGGVAEAGTVIGRQKDTSGGGGIYVRYTTGAISGDVAGVQLGAAGTGNHAIGWGIHFLSKFKLPDVTSIRAFIGLTDQTLATMVGADNPAGNYVGFQFSTPRGDANWKAVRKNGTTQVVSATTITPDILPLSYQLINQGALGAAAFYDQFFALLQAITWVSGSPSVAANLHVVAGIQTQTTASRSLDLYNMRGMNNV